MEQQINPNEPIHEVQSGDQNKALSVSTVPKIMKIILGGMVCVLGVSVAGWYVYQKSTVIPPETQIEKKENIVSKETETPETEVEKTLPVTENVQGMIAYNTMNIPVLKTRAMEFQTGSVKNIGTIISGVFKDKILAMGLLSESSPYVYFITDTMGNTVAWDQDFVFAESNYCYDDCAQWNDFFGLTADKKQNLDFLPIEFSSKATRLVRLENGTEASFVTDYSFKEQSDVAQVQVGSTQSGFKVTKIVDGGNPYFIQTPFGQVSEYRLTFPFGISSNLRLLPDFMSSDDVPQLTWTSGTKTVASYRYGQYAYGWEDCYAVFTNDEIEIFSNDEIEVGLIATGITSKGDQVFEMDAQKYPKVYECLHEKTKRYVYDEQKGSGEYVETVAYSDFIGTHPMFFWKHPFGDTVAFMRSDVVPAAEKAKPVIYLYPEKEEKINVKVAPVGGFTVTDPEYGNGWNVNATPEGVITNSADGKQYPYLFWEGGKEGVVLTPKEGFVVAKEDVSATLEKALSQFGLNEQERADFKEFWVPKLSHAPYYFLTFISQSEIDRVAPMTVSPKPDTVIRVLMDYKPFVEAIDVEPLVITSTPRTGFTVVEWGGIVRD